MIETLIDKLDNYEIIRDKVALILAEEQASQQILAADAGKDPDLWKMRVYVERSNPWEFLRTDDGMPPADRSPVVCVWFDTSSTTTGASQLVDVQQTEITINIDIYGIGVTEILPGSAGQLLGDSMAQLEAQRAARLVRNIIMSDTYYRLGFTAQQQIVGARWVSQVQAFQPEFGNQNAQHIAGARVTLQVKAPETGPQTAGVKLEEIGITVTDETGAVLLDNIFQSTS